MYNVLLVENDKNYQKLFALNLNAYVGAETYFCESAVDAISFLESDEIEINAIISNDIINDEISANRIFSYLKKLNSDIPVVCLGKSDYTDANFIVLKGNDWKSVIREVAKILEVTPTLMLEKNKLIEELYPVRVKYLVDVDVEECATDVFIKSGTGHETLIEAGKPFPSIILEELFKNNVEFLYIYKEKRLAFVKQFSENILLKLKDKTLAVEDRIAVGQVSFHTVGECLQMGGMSKDTITIAKASIENMVDIIRQDETLDSLLEILKKNSQGDVYQHALLTAAICSQVVNKVDWSGEDSDSIICFVALFHDISLDSDAMVGIYSSQELDNSKLSTFEKKRVEQHALNASMLVKNSSICPYGADMIILQHHGATNGVGFRDKLNNSLSQLTIIFIVAEHYADSLLSIDKEFFNKENVIGFMRTKFHKGMYKQVVEVINKL